MPAAATTSYSAQWNSGWQRVFILAAIVRLGRLSPALLRDRLGWRSQVQVGVGILVLSSPPALIFLATYVPTAAMGKYGHRPLEWSMWLSLAAAIICLASYACWHHVAKEGWLIDSSLRRRRSTFVLNRWAARWYSWKVQLVVVVAAVVTSMAFVYINREEIETYTPLLWQSYFAVGWVTSLGANAVYWMFAAPQVVVMLVHGDCIKLSWMYPAATPAARALVRGVLFSGSWLSGGTLGVMLVAFVGPQVTELASIRGLILAFLVLAGLLVAFAVIRPVAVVTNACNRRKEASIVKVGRTVLKIRPALLGTNADIEIARAQLLGEISAANSVPFGTASLVQYGAVIFTSLFAPVATILDTIVREVMK